MKTVTHNRWPFLVETDQERCYDRRGQSMSCQEMGQDASFPKIQDLAAPDRFLADVHVVKDRFTQAVWSRDANPTRFPQTWHEALGTVAKMREQRMHGYSEWQLPSRDLLFSLISHQHINPAVAARHPFQNVFNGFYWSRDSSCRLPDQAWYVHMGGGRIHRGMKHGSYLVWPVCPGPTQSRNNAPENLVDPFMVDGNEVIDQRTGLIWLLNADPIGRRLSWEAALAAVCSFNGSRTGKKQAWRLPNIRELESLVALDTHTPALPSGHPFVNVQDAYWSSTTSVYEPRYAWALYCQDGYVGVGFKPDETFYLWPVRTA